MRSRFRSSDTAGVAEGKTQAGTSEELCSLVQSSCSVDRNNRARDKKALLRQPGELHDSRSRSPSGMPDNAGNVIRPSLRESLCEERLPFQNYNILSLDRKVSVLREGKSWRVSLNVDRPTVPKVH